jgi:hypothetical protein
MAKFVWLRDSAFPRTGPRLEKGKEHDAGLYDPNAVKVWILTGAARMVDEAPEAQEPVKFKRAAKPSGGR